MNARNPDPIDPLNRARAVLTYWQRHNQAVVDIAWSRLSESDLPDDKALMAEVARERVAKMGLDVKALPFNAARFPPVFDHITLNSNDERWDWINRALDRAQPVMDWITRGIVVACLAGTVGLVLWKVVGL